MTNIYYTLFSLQNLKFELALNDKFSRYFTDFMFQLTAGMFLFDIVWKLSMYIKDIHSELISGSIFNLLNLKLGPFLC